MSVQEPPPERLTVCTGDLARAVTKHHAEGCAGDCEIKEGRPMPADSGAFTLPAPTCLGDVVVRFGMYEESKKGALMLLSEHGESRTILWLGTRYREGKNSRAGCYHRRQGLPVAHVGVGRAEEWERNAR